MTPQEIADTMSPEEIEFEIQESRKELARHLARIKGRNAFYAFARWAKIFTFCYIVYRAFLSFMA